jgi:hypothetical protein
MGVCTVVVTKEEAVNKERARVLVGVLWLILGVWALTYQKWVGVAMFVVGLAYLAYTVVQRRANPTR